VLKSSLNGGSLPTELSESQCYFTGGFSEEFHDEGERETSPIRANCGFNARNNEGGRTPCSLSDFSEDNGDGREPQFGKILIPEAEEQSIVGAVTRQLLSVCCSDLNRVEISDGTRVKSIVTHTHDSLCEWVMRSSQGRYLHAGQHKHRINAQRYQCFEWDSKARSSVRACGDSSCLRPCGHCARHRAYIQKLSTYNYWRTATCMCKI
jgi:hypothetical protein